MPISESIKKVNVAVQQLKIGRGTERESHLLTQLRQFFWQMPIFQGLSGGYRHYSFYGRNISWQRDLLQVQALVNLAMVRFRLAAQP